MVIFHSYVNVYQRVKAGSHGIPMSGTARLLLARLAPWEPMCRRCQENGGLGLWLGSEWGDDHSHQKKGERTKQRGVQSHTNHIFQPLEKPSSKVAACVWAMSPLQFWHRGQPFQGAMQCNVEPVRLFGMSLPRELNRPSLSKFNTSELSELCWLSTGHYNVVPQFVSQVGEHNSNNLGLWMFMADIPILNEGYKPTNLTGGHHLVCCRAKFLSGGEHTLELRWIKLGGVTMTMMTWELDIQIS